ncbi:hypothetical protein, partial [Pseudomonas viridiflava]|uniref:hypothetical protein n=1 Tax=Pseudomonas viridiflava TaxID=33069 RepID=UPI0019D276CA
ADHRPGFCPQQQDSPGLEDHRTRLMPGLMNESVRDLRRFVHHPLGELLANSYNQCTASVAQHPVGVMS